jgi:hypothetical protein
VSLCSRVTPAELWHQSPASNTSMMEAAAIGQALPGDGNSIRVLAEPEVLYHGSGRESNRALPQQNAVDDARRSYPIGTLKSRGGSDCQTHETLNQT